MSLGQASLAHPHTLPVRLGWGLWLLGLLLLPLTSLAVIPLATSVRPPTPLLAGLALVLLLAGGCVPWRSVLAPNRVRVLGLFVVWAVVATVIGLCVGNHPLLKGNSGVSATAKGLLSLAMGACVYLTAQVALQDRERRQQSERWLIAGMTLTVLMAVVQVLAWFGVCSARDLSLWVTDRITVQFGAADYLDQGRAWGLSLEPSWMASALAVILLPIGLARALVDGSRLGWYATVLAYVGIGLTTSRGGLLSVAVVTALAVLWLATALARSLPGRRRLWGAVILILLCSISFVLASRSYIVSGVAFPPPVQASPAVAAAPPPALAVPSAEPVLADAPRPPWADALQRSGFLYRALCGIGAWQTFRAHLISGTGLGLSGWEIRQNLPAWSRHDASLPEVADDLALVEGRLPNAKNLPLRLLAELGLVGALVYGWFLCLHRPRCIAGRPEASLLPMLIFAAIAVDWLTLDSFALVATWLALAWAANAGEAS